MLCVWPGCVSGGRGAEAWGTEGWPARCQRSGVSDAAALRGPAVSSPSPPPPPPARLGSPCRSRAGRCGPVQAPPPQRGLGTAGRAGRQVAVGRSPTLCPLRVLSSASTRAAGRPAFLPHAAFGKGAFLVRSPWLLLGLEGEVFTGKDEASNLPPFPCPLSLPGRPSSTSPGSWPGVSTWPCPSPRTPPLLSCLHLPHRLLQAQLRGCPSTALPSHFLDL